MDVYQLPLQQLANLCGMDFCGMVYTGGYNLMRKVADKDLHVQKAQEHAKVLVRKINSAMESFK